MANPERVISYWLWAPRVEARREVYRICGRGSTRTAEASRFRTVGLALLHGEGPQSPVRRRRPGAATLLFRSTACDGARSTSRALTSTSGWSPDRICPCLTGRSRRPRVKDASGDHKASSTRTSIPARLKHVGTPGAAASGRALAGWARRPAGGGPACTASRGRASDAPALLSLEDVQTLFHEFGHALAPCCRGCRTSLTVPRDFVELPSRILENWALLEI